MKNFIIIINKYKNTSVCIINDSISELGYIICISENQNPLLFNINKKQLIKEYNIEFNFNYIYELKLSSPYFCVIGKNNNKNKAILYHFYYKKYLKIFNEVE
jgi:hypothetical protein